MSQVFIMLRGMPGSGKSTFGAFLAKTIPDCLQFETDMYLMKNGEYVFDQSKLSACRKQCEIDVANALFAGKSVVLTNVSASEGAIKAYTDILASVNHYNRQGGKPEVVFTCSIVENRHGNKSIHAVPEESMKAIQKGFKVKLC